MTIRVPSGLKAAELNILMKLPEPNSPLSPLRVARARPESASQMLAVLSSDAVRIRVPSGLNAAETTLSSCPLSVTRTRPESASQTRAVLSSDAVTTRIPSEQPRNAVFPRLINDHVDAVRINLRDQLVAPDVG